MIRSGRALTLFILGRPVHVNVDEIVQQVASAIALPMGVEVIEIRWLGTGKARAARLVVDQDGGVSTDTCVAISKEFDLEWEARSAAPRDFSLEVTSPGPDRKLRTERDFARVTARWVQIERTGSTGPVTIVGKVARCTDGTLFLSEADGVAPAEQGTLDCIEVPLNEIHDAKVLFVIGTPTLKGKASRRTKRR
jgi:ribosome maturation factor RimP